jgi:hypothetical protein
LLFFCLHDNISNQLRYLNFQNFGYFCKQMISFGAGCNSPPAVIRSAQYGFVQSVTRSALKQDLRRRLTRCNSETDSIVWMGEGKRERHCFVMACFVLAAVYLTVEQTVCFVLPALFQPCYLTQSFCVFMYAYRPNAPFFRKEGFFCYISTLSGEGMKNCDF